jgi:hypothetical protein
MFFESALKVAADTQQRRAEPAGQSAAGDGGSPSHLEQRWFHFCPLKCRSAPAEAQCQFFHFSFDRHFTERGQALNHRGQVKAEDSRACRVHSKILPDTSRSCSTGCAGEHPL